jgi:hypothetical protein
MFRYKYLECDSLSGGSLDPLVGALAPLLSITAKF